MDSGSCIRYSFKHHKFPGKQRLIAVTVHSLIRREISRHDENFPSLETFNVRAHMYFLSRLFGRKPRPPLAKDVVTFDDEKIIRTAPDGKLEVVRWDDLQEVSIITTDEGPFVDDVFWVLSGSSSGCLAPSEAVGTKDLLPKLQQLPGFDNDAVIQAMGSTSNAKFLCWRRDSGL